MSEPVKRRRNTLLAALELMRRSAGRPNLTQVVAFLYVCENEGLNVAQLADLLGLTSATASRAATCLEAAPPEGMGWVASRSGDQLAHARLLFLTASGRSIRDRLQGLIEEVRPIVTPGSCEVANM